ncbi:MAG TPA: cytochrome c oxidase assembly protein [Opitutaceae bacterium]|jgi:putative membrane protein|nr:cytochrome c oxidase assembly protein [Opitutaceae bacterium]
MIDWRHWHNEPFLTGGLILAGWLYALLAGPLRANLAPGEPYPRAHAWRFYSALVLFYLAVGSPLDQIGERFLLTAHMGQHLVIIYPVPLLILLGIPGWMIDPLLARPAVRVPVALLVKPLPCAVISSLVISLWHLPFLYEWTLQDKLLHVGEHLMFLAVSLLYWWPLVSPSKVLPPPNYGTRMLYLVGTEILMIPVAAYIVFSNDILYPTYEYAPRLIADFTPAQDQLTAGVFMKVAGVVVSLLAMAICFYKWSKESEPARAR